MKKYFIKTYGCQMNENDSEIVAGILESNGYKEAKDIKKADIVIVNTCSIRDGAERKAKGLIDLLGSLKSKNKVIGIIGCMAERLGEDLLKKYKFIDFVLGPNKEADLKQIISKYKKGNFINKEKILKVGDSGEFRDSFIAKRVSATNAWVTIMEGCDNYCSYCIVPYVRGREKSRKPEEIIKEIEALDKNIFKEVTLLGQNVNSYKYGFADLLKKVSKIDGIKRVRFMTSHPKDMTEEIILTVKENPKICESFHLPLQSGDNAVLRNMNRGYTREYYRDLVKKIRDKIPSASITSDAIAGFSGETEDQFQNTLDLISSLELDSVNTLAFDPRPGTKAFDMEGKISKSIVKQRLARLMRVVEETSRKKNRQLVGSIQEVLVENKGFGRTRGGKIVRFKQGSSKTGDLVNIEIISAKSWVLQGDIID